MTKTRVLLISVLVVGLGVAFSQYSVSLKNFIARTVRAAIGGSADMMLVPGTQTTQVNVGQTVSLQTDLHGIPVDGIQAVIKVTGNLPANLAFTPTSNAGLNAITNSFTVSSPTQAQLTLALLPSSIPSPYTHTGVLTLGQFTYTPQSPGTSFTMTFETQTTPITKVTANDSNAQNIVAFPSGATFTYSVATPTPSPTPTPSKTPTPTPSSTPQATATPTPSATSTPTSTPSPNPSMTPTPTPSPTPTSTPTPSPSPTPSHTPVPTATPTVSPTSTPVSTATPTPTAVGTATPTPKVSATPRPVDPKVEVFRLRFKLLLQKFRERIKNQ